MRELKNRDLIIGLIILIVLASTALILIVQKEIKKTPKEDKVVAIDITQEYTTVTEELEPNEEQNQMEKKASESNKQSGKTLPSDKTTSNKSTTSEDFVNEKEDKYKPALLKEYKGDSWQLEELYHYWNDYQLNAVEDLIRLERVRAITDELKGTNQFYYYGERDKNNKPSGSGLAIYADNTYYCGEWSNGMRNGQGMWLRIYPDKPATIGGTKGVMEHSYNGKFVNDYPNGAGQEHYDYDLSLLNKNDAFANVIGNFKDGYYDGEVYIMTIDKDGHTIDWDTDVKAGVFQAYAKEKSASGFEPVWEKKDSDGLEDEDYFWIHPTKNKNYGIIGLKK